jgi:NO-binding membrane sensor protein with MHYT domain
MPFGVIEFFILVLLPGSWITFSLPLTGLRPWARWLTGMALSPLVVCAQFYVLRLLGASFERTVPLLVLINVPALFLIRKRMGKLALPDLRTAALLAMILALPVVCLSPQLLHSPTRMLYGHPWMHTEIAYRLAAGDLIPDDPDLAGIRLFYPWEGDLYQAILSYTLGSPPLYSYIWTNLLFLICICALAAGVVAEMGGGQRARLTSGVSLFFGVNIVGYSIFQLLPNAFTIRHPGPFGDYRYTPWVLKFIDYQQMPLALAMFMAMAYLMIRQWPRGGDKSSLAVIGLLLCSIGLVYPIVFPAACGLIVAQAIALFFFPEPGTPRGLRLKQALFVGLVLLVSCGVAALHYHLMSRDRVTSALALSNWHSIASKCVASVLATCPLVAGLLFVLRSSWKRSRGPTAILLLGATSSFLLYVLLILPYFGNEYKFMFTAAICLAPFSPLALDGPLRRLGRWALPLGVAATLILAVPLIQKTRVDWFREDFPLPPLDVSSFYLRMEERESLAALCNAIRERTPKNTIVVLEHEPVHFPTLTSRGLYAPPRGTLFFPGLNLKPETLLTQVKGYSKLLLETRQTEIERLFHPESAVQRAAALESMLAFHRPVAIVLDHAEDVALREWLIQARSGKLLYSGNGRDLLLVEHEHQD